MLSQKTTLVLDFQICVLNMQRPYKLGIQKGPMTEERGRGLGVV